MDIKNFIEGLGEKKEELLKKAALCKSAEELFALAKENSVDLNEEDATELFASMELKQGKLSDDELDSVAGGGSGKMKRQLQVQCTSCQKPYVFRHGSGDPYPPCPFCGYNWGQ